MLRYFQPFLILVLVTPTLSYASIPYHVSISDPDDSFGDDIALVLANFDAAISDWSRFIKSNGELWIQIDVTENTTAGRFDGNSTGLIFSTTRDGFNIFEQSGLYKLRTGQSIDKTRPDILIHVNPEYMRSNYWIDPNPDKRTDPVPPGKIDLVTVFAHELGHGFGMTGWLNPQTGAPPAHKNLTVYDSAILMGNSLSPVFTGSISTELYEGHVPVTFFQTPITVQSIHNSIAYSVYQDPQQNIYHLGRFSSSESESDLSFFSLMSGCWGFPSMPQAKGLRIPVNALDAAILEDLGVPSASE